MENSTNEHGNLTHCKGTLNATENEDFLLLPKSETIDVILNSSSCTQQFTYCEKSAKTPKDMFDKKFELNDVHIGSDFNDKMLLMPSDQKNATVFIKID